jgi:hypothetical protein
MEILDENERSLTHDQDLEIGRLQGDVHMYLPQVKQAGYILLALGLISILVAGSLVFNLANAALFFLLFVLLKHYPKPVLIIACALYGLSILSFIIRHPTGILSIGIIGRIAIMWVLIRGLRAANIVTRVNETLAKYGPEHVIRW